MRSATLLVAASTFATSALAQVAGFAVFSTPAEGEVVPAGKPYVVKWDAGEYEGPATLSLVGGESQGTQVPLDTLATGLEVTSNQYKWNVDCSLGDAKIYGLKITLESNATTFQWSFPFQIDNSDCSSTGSSTTAATPTPSPSTYATVTPTSKSTTEKPTTATSYPTISLSTKTSTTTDKSEYPTTTIATTTLATTTTTPATHTTTAPTTTAPVTTVPTAAATKVAGSFALAGMAVAAVLAL